MPRLSRRPVSEGLHDEGLPDGFCACPVDVAFRVVGKKWTVLLIRNMLRGQRHFNEFLANIEGINPKVLSLRLKELENERLVAKHVSRTGPVTIEYALTEKGLAVLPILRQMVRWSVQFAPDRVFDKGKTPSEVERCVADWERTLVLFNTILLPPNGHPLPKRRVARV